MKHLGFIIISLIFSVQAFAAKFTPVEKVSSPAIQKLATAAQAVIKKETVFGDAGSVEAFSFTRKKGEENDNTIKQLSYANGGANSDDSHEDLQAKSVGELTDYALYAVENQEGEYEADFRIARIDLVNALKAVKADKKLQIFGSGHADEDGSWQVLYVLDTANNQVLLVKIGFSGT